MKRTRKASRYSWNFNWILWTLLPFKFISEWKNHFIVKHAKLSIKQPFPSDPSIHLVCACWSCTLFPSHYSLWTEEKRERRGGEQFIFSCYFVLAKGNIQNRITYTCVWTGHYKGESYLGQKIHLSESWGKQEDREKTMGELEIYSRNQSLQEHVTYSKIHTRVLAVSDMMHQR